jgi:hypothetical protein
VLDDAGVDAVMEALVAGFRIIDAEGGIEHGEQGVGLRVVCELALEEVHRVGAIVVGHSGTERASGGNRKRISMTITAKTKKAPMKNRV